ncbi:ArnT family glycosyltransferase [Kaarinaea lacus]
MAVSVVNNKADIKANLKQLVSNCYSCVDDSTAVSNQNQTPLLLLSYLLLLCVPLFLYTFRTFDDNRLVSWYWGFTQPQLFLLLAVLAIVLALLVLAIKVQWRMPENVALLTVVSFVVTIPFWETPEVIIDNARYFTQAKFVELYGVGYFFREWGEGIFAWTDLPLIPFIYGLAFSVFGEHREVVQVFSSLFFAGTIAVTYFLGKVLWSHHHGIIAATLLLGIPYIYSQIPLMMVDIPTMFFLSLAVLVSVLAIKEGTYSYIVTAATAIVLALLSKYSAWVFLSVIPLAVVTQPQQNWRINVTRLVKISFIVCILLAIVVFWYYPILIEQIRILFNYQWGALGGWQESNVSTFLFHIHPLISIAALVSTIIAIKNRDKNFLLISGMLVLVILLDIQRIRYLLIIFPMLALMAAYAVVGIPNHQLKRFMVAGVALTSYVIALSLSAGFLKSTSANNIKSAGAYLDAMDVNAVEVLVLPQQRSIINPQITVAMLDYHTQKTLVYSGNDHIRVSSEIPAISKSPVRFTWAYLIPPYYQNSFETDRDHKALAVIYSDKNQIMSDELQFRLANYRLIKQYQSATGVYKFKTFVNLYVSI